MQVCSRVSVWFPPRVVDIIEFTLSFVIHTGHTEPCIETSILCGGGGVLRMHSLALPLHLK